MNRKSPKTLEAVERERERENLFIQRGIRLLDYIVYCHLENKNTKVCKFVKFNKRIRDRTIQEYYVRKSVKNTSRSP